MVERSTGARLGGLLLRYAKPLMVCRRGETLSVIPTYRMECEHVDSPGRRLPT
jgi:hypothetical protein